MCCNPRCYIALSRKNAPSSASAAHNRTQRMAAVVSRASARTRAFRGRSKARSIVPREASTSARVVSERRDAISDERARAGSPAT
jgi:hypothetical protein